MIILILLLAGFVLTIVFLLKSLGGASRTRELEIQLELKEEEIKNLKREVESLREVYEGLKAQYEELENSIQEREAGA